MPTAPPAIHHQSADATDPASPPPVRPAAIGAGALPIAEVNPEEGAAWGNA